MTDESKRAGRSRLIGLVVVVVLTIVPAAYVVVRNAGKISSGRVPVTLRPPPPDTLMKHLRFSVRSKLQRLESRFERIRGTIAAPTLAQESLIAACTVSFAATHEALAALDTATARESRERIADTLRVRFAGVKPLVAAFAATRGVADIDDDSLDIELKKVLGN